MHLRTRATRLRDERGFTMASVMITMFLVGLFALGAYQAAQGDIIVSRNDQDRKRAYEAAEAGLAWYAFQLERDPAYWTKCTTVPDVATGVPAPVNNPWNGVGPDPRKWRTLIASSEQYTLEMLPTNSTTCSTTDPAGSMLDDGVLTVRATGMARGQKRSLIGSFRRRSFVDFVYFTQWETLDPVAYLTNPTPSEASTICNKPRSQRDSRCTVIQFITQDSILGPLHTNDESLYVNGNPTFGRNTGDKVEISGPMPGWTGSGTPIFAGKRVAPAPSLSMPPSNGALQQVAGTNYKFTGNTCISFNANGSATVKNGMKFKDDGGRIDCSKAATLTRTLTFPDANGNSVIYVGSDAACTDTYDRYQRYDNGYTCGDVAVSGTYNTSVTIAAANDIIINGDLRKTDVDDMLGLVANNFVRVYHPINYGTGSTCNESNGLGTGAMTNVTIEAAILALSHSFIVDNWGCGPQMGTLTVKGAIAQYYRGPVGSTVSGGRTGYTKDYQYDDRLKFKEPPNFLDPVQTKWNLIRRGEQQPAR